MFVLIRHSKNFLFWEPVRIHPYLREIEGTIRDYEQQGRILSVWAAKNSLSMNLLADQEIKVWLRKTRAGHMAVALSDPHVPVPSGVRAKTWRVG